MKKILSLLFLTLALSVCAFAKTHTMDIIAPESITYTLAENEDTLKCTLYVEENGLFGLRVRSVSTTSDFQERITVSLYDKGRELSSFTTKAQGFNEEKYYMLEGLAEGEYTLKIRNDTKFGDVSFDIDTFFTPWENVESQGERSFDGATLLTSGERFKGGVMLSDTSDFYKFVMPEDGYAVVDMYSSELKYFTLYDEEKNEIGTMEIKLDDPTKVFETRCGLKKGVYYVSVTPEEDYLNPEYSLEMKALYDAEFEKEYNNTMTDATPILFGKTLRGNLFGCDDVDYYSFSIDKKSKAKLTLNDLYLASKGHYNFTVLDADGKVIAEQQKCGTKTIEITLEEGRYYAVVSCPAEEYFTPFGYKISVKASPLSSESEPESGEDAAEPPVSEDEAETVVVWFDDVDENSWYAEEILAARQKKLIEGSENNLFRPEDGVTIGEVVTMAARMYERIYGTEIPTDGDYGEKWYTPYVLYAAASGIVNPDDFSDYEARASRAETAYIFASLFGDEIKYDEKIVIPDVDKEERYHDEICLLYSAGILKGMNDDGDFFPNEGVTRAQATVIMLRCLDVLTD